MTTHNTTRIYLDNASTTPINEDVLVYMDSLYRDVFGNASALYGEGVDSKNLLENAREQISKTIGAHSNEIIFTSGGTESDNLALLGVVFNYKEKNKSKKPHIIVSAIEHPAVLETAQFISKHNLADVSYAPVSLLGIVDLSELKKLLRPETILVSIMHANNEIGTIQPIRDVSKMIRHFKKHVLDEVESMYPLIHTDACQSFGYLPIQTQILGVDLLTLNGSKIYGPKGVGVLYKKRKIPFSNIFSGGDQEMGYRPGTENIPSICALSKAVNITEENKAIESARMCELRDYFILKLTESFEIKTHGSLTDRLPNNINVSFIGYQSEQIVVYLDAEGIAVSEKSACKSESGEVSHVLRALYGSNTEILKWGSVRFSLGRMTTKKELDTTIEKLKKIFTLLKKAL